MIYLALVLFVLDLVLLDRWLTERQKHGRSRATLRWWRRHAIVPAGLREFMP